MWPVRREQEKNPVSKMVEQSISIFSSANNTVHFARILKMCTGRLMHKFKFLFLYKYRVYILQQKLYTIRDYDQIRLWAKFRHLYANINKFDIIIFNSCRRHKYIMSSQTFRLLAYMHMGQLITSKLDNFPRTSHYLDRQPTPYQGSKRVLCLTACTDQNSYPSW